MKLATLKQGGTDGSLVVVSRDLSQYRKVGDIAPTLQAALDDWVVISPKLQAVYQDLNDNRKGEWHCLLIKHNAIRLCQEHTNGQRWFGLFKSC
ncbi:hypothetical protein [Moraxella catarrhalis]|uniref:hypothetical protein n=1 Tax=Moraxella catarrhalis TaxID=480 RepID=UPI00222880F6|nr:hypothetical protein [Moraxella catarrhalis]